MDIAKYVGLFLLKNEYCFLPGIGSLQIEKKPSVYDKETQQMSAPVYEVKYRQVGGSIDDSFANFIANNERISIAHAANHLKDFCAHAKADMREGRAVEIPGIGKFTSEPNDSIHFVTDPHLHIEGKAIPFFKNSTAVNLKKEEAISNIIERTNIREPKADEEIEYQAPSVNWGKVFIFITIIAVLIGGAILLYWYMNKNKGEQNTPGPIEQTTAPVSQSAAVTPLQDTVAQAPAQTVANNGSLTYKVALHQYASREKAESRVAKLKSYGNSTVEFYAKDSANYYVVMSVTSPVADTSHVIDSLRKQFNPGGKVEVVR